MIHQFQVVWNITSKCNQYCKFCFRKKCKDNSLCENKKIVDNLAKMNISTLSLSGGEAILYKDLFELVKYIRFKLPNTELILNTNGQNIDEYKLDKIINNFDAITLPIESTNNDFNREIGRGEEHFHNVLKILDYCNNKIKIKINTILMKKNINEIEKINKIIKDYNIKRWKIFKFLSIRDAKKFTNDFSITEEDSKAIEEKISNLNKLSKIEISYNKEQKYKTKFFIYPDGTIENNRLEYVNENAMTLDIGSESKYEDKF